MAMVEKRRGKEYERIRRPGRGNLGRAGSNTTRYDFFFEAVKGRGTKRFAHAWRGISAEKTEKALRRDYRKRGYDLNIDVVETIGDSIKRSER
jgi:hypothetical protein